MSVYNFIYLSVYEIAIKLFLLFIAIQVSGCVLTFLFIIFFLRDNYVVVFDIVPEIFAENIVDFLSS